jgi:hypothetical protein
MLDRIIGVVTLKEPVYREIADDKTATSQAAIIVIIATLVQGFFQGLVRMGTGGTVHVSVVGAIVGAIVTVIFGLIAWVFSAWVLAFVAQRMEGKTDTSEMMRVTGFVQVFSLVAVLNILLAISPMLGCITGLIGLAVAILSLIGYLIGVREAAEFSTGKAVVAAIIAAIVNFIVIAVIGGAIMAAVLGAMALTK